MQQRSTFMPDHEALSAVLSAAHCNNCGSPAQAVLYPAGRAQVHRIVRCVACGLMYADPLPASNLSHYLVPADRVQPLRDDSPEVRRGRDKLPDYLAIEPVLSKLLPNRGSVVEIGAYSGLLLENFRRAGCFGKSDFRPWTSRSRLAVRQIDDPDAISLTRELGQRPTTRDLHIVWVRADGDDIEWFGKGQRHLKSQLGVATAGQTNSRISFAKRCG